MIHPPISPVSALLLLAAVSPALAEDPVNQGTLTLVNEAGYNKLNITLTVQGYGSDSDESTITGTVQARLDIDPATGRSPELTLLGGNIEGTPIHLLIKYLIFITVVDVTSTTIGGTVNTITPPGLIDPFTGQGDAAQHQFEINSGTVSGTAFGGAPISFDFSPESTNPGPVGGPGSGIVEVAISPAGTSSTRALFDVTVVFPINLSEDYYDPDLAITATFNVTGTMKATGQVSVPLPYPDWAAANGIPGAPATDDSNGDGIQNGIVWALGLSHSDDPRPHMLLPDPAVPKRFMLQLPATGSSGAITVQTSVDLSPGSWIPLLPGYLSAGANPLPPGTTGTVTIYAPLGNRRFLRLMSNP